MQSRELLAYVLIGAIVMIVATWCLVAWRAWVRERETRRNHRRRKG